LRFGDLSGNQQGSCALSDCQGVLPPHPRRANAR
jgi:hypothetical protein